MKNLNVMAPINSLGYGIASKNIVRVLAKKTNLSLFPIGEPMVENNDEKILVEESISKSRTFDPTAPCLKIWHEFDLGIRVGKGEMISFPFFELNKINPVKRHHLLSCDKVYTPSEWSKDIINNELPDLSVKVIPLGVDQSVFYPTLASSRRHEEENSKFVIFNCGKWEIRKGLKERLDIFREAFPDEQDVELWMMCSNPVASEKINSQWSSFYRQDRRVKLLDRVRTQQELANVINTVDCGLFPSRAEGWNFELLELMACGKKVVATEYSAHTQYCNSENSFTIKPKRMEKAFDGLYFPEGEVGEWASLDGIKSNFAKAIRSIYEDWKSGKSIDNPKGVETAMRFSWESTRDKILEDLNG
jgi:glycosyltransferase involved in cell wall biosynthesis